MMTPPSGKIARGDALGESDHIGIDAEDLARGEDMAKPAEARHHLVGDIEDVVVAADLADALEIAVGRHDDTARGLHGLTNESADSVGADPGHRVAELLDQEIGEGGKAHALRPAERIGRGQLDHQLVGAIHPIPVARAAVERGLHPQLFTAGGRAQPHGSSGDDGPQPSRSVWRCGRVDRGRHRC
ncbi:hypothetical protein X759_27835 [Mesorhizobium sp. LSHC420B00]|nr:hypothetical protein X759_27835 [Mesorhizobium sp. LSHC420B00]